MVIDLSYLEVSEVNKLVLEVKVKMNKGNKFFVNLGILVGNREIEFYICIFIVFLEMNSKSEI